MLPSRRASVRLALRRAGRVFAVLALAALASSWWFARHPKAWRDAQRARIPAPAADVLEWLGLPAADLTDALGWSGTDVTAPATRPAPEGEISFAGLPVRTGAPAPGDIKVLKRGDFAVGWSPSLKCPVWCAYHVPRRAMYEAGLRPSFRKDPAVPDSPSSSAYSRTGYDRGHLAPNHAIATRFGPAAQKRTFLTTNIAPQSPALNRGVWREMEHRIADFWTARWGEVWVVVGIVATGCETLSGADVRVPEAFYQIAVAQDGGEVRAVAVLFGQDVPWRAWPAGYIVSIDELERLTGLDFMPELDTETARRLESATPTRLWPVRFADAFRQLFSHNG